MQWFRMWVDAMDDEKLKLLAFEDRWHFVAILCCKRKGILDAPDTDALRDRKVGAKLGLADRERDEARRRLIEVGLIDEQWQPKGWTKRQFISDADPTALDRKHRQRLKKRHARVTGDNRDSHAPVTDESLEGHTAQSQITDTESDTDSERKGSAEGKVRAARSTLATRLPADFGLTPERRAVAEAEKADPEREFAQFVDHFRAAPGVKGRKNDWDATWRNWCRRAPDFKPRVNGTAKTPWVRPITAEEAEARERARGEIP